jgi:AAA domain
MKFSAVLGPPGSGKTTRMREQAKATGESIKLTSTTGISAVNLGPSVTTLNSVMGFYDEASLRQSIRTGKFRQRVQQVSANFNVVAVDELSMLSGEILQILVDGFLKVEHETDQEAPELLVLGDYLQLPPVTGTFAFEAPCWQRFADTTTVLTGSYRQKDDLAFFAALQAARAGDGINCLLALRSAGVSHRCDVDPNFNGTTLSALNASVDKINRERFATISTPERFYECVRWGVDDSAWKQIPQRVAVKEGASVMILANKRRNVEADGEGSDLLYVNGDSGKIVELHDGGVSVELLRNHETIFVSYVTRNKYVPDRPSGIPSQWNEKEQAWLIGYLKYLPVRLSYASSYHKVQGLTLDRVQLDARTKFAGEPGMIYTALSRCRSAKDLVIVTPSAGSFARRVNTHQKVRRWI